MTSTSTVFVPTIDASTVEAYRAADPKGKGKIRANVQKAANAAVMAMDAEAAANHLATLAALTTSHKSAKVEVDPKQVIAQRVADLERAAHLLRTGAVVPTDLDAEWTDEDFVGGFLNLTDVEADETNASKIAGTKITRTTQTRSIQQVIDNAFEDLDEGDFLTVAQIRAKGQWEGYVPSDGAIAARLFPKSGDCTLDGVEPTEAVAGGAPRGATKV